MLVLCLNGGGNCDAEDLNSIAAFFRRTIGAIKLKIEALGYEAPPKVRTPNRAFTRNQMDKLAKLYSTGIAISDCVFVARVKWKIKIAPATLRKYMAEDGVKIRPRGRIAKVRGE